MSREIREWKEGEDVEWRGPYEESTVEKWHKLPRLLVVAAGTGLAPFIRIIDSLLSDPDCDTIIRLLYCVRTAKDILFRDKLCFWAQHWNISITIVTSRSDEQDAPAVPYLLSSINGRLTADSLKHQVDMFNRERHEMKVAICGGVTFEKDIINFSTKNAGIASEDIVRFTL